jgi:hypothetical protein
MLAIVAYRGHRKLIIPQVKFLYVSLLKGPDRAMVDVEQYKAQEKRREGERVDDGGFVRATAGAHPADCSPAAEPSNGVAP